MDARQQGWDLGDKRGRGEKGNVGQQYRLGRGELLLELVTERTSHIAFSKKPYCYTTCAYSMTIV